MKTKLIGYWLLLIGCLAFTSCHSDTVFSEFQTIPTKEWSVDVLPQFDYTIPDTAASYNIVLYVRHTERYPYQNMWLFVNNNHRIDTIEFYLADDRGQWLGDRHYGFIEMPVLLEENYHFPDTGTYRMTVQHGMRDSLLRGVSDIGVEVTKLKIKN
ncbi:MAG: gliding motility lipoprotein GldH [Paludibacteraceae bacterium]|nr:gliding motility lipoprotein GldH [Paludibacteraceae bacterium]MBQ4018384.1 gliding motility lipoprotein GldH [Paludibacteraceae bacterium]